MKICFLILLSVFSFTAWAQDVPVKWATQETFFEDLTGKDLPAFSGLTINKKQLSNADLKNQVVVINFWFEKCPPCIAEMPELNSLMAKYGKKAVRFIGITHDSPANARRFQKRNGYKYEIVSLSKDEITKLNINHGFPSNVLVGKDGKIIYATANISFSDPQFKAKSILFEEKLKAALEN
ncbi:cytochrome c biogenesis protein CcmG/thiol:disulfide interchange protein DsbE [Pedobacter sp. W3I1]|uniref:TlpA family protein disulfide reductase n=1 Tax=Pedobacter sp. W3I1 TaxID=3042291 RepID=UPI00277D2F0C|nr:TlpA disulfide reductase family protein [Pedobacter sp. W3I1]MDQ0636946.1 cytochrome c biogenesis protein CcmG/thiol:disulfide interchange protein DsbE [Pedobacter sp. W3I1]